MTRKDFVLIANALKDAAEMASTAHPDFRRGVNQAASDIAYALRTTNPRFDRERFLKACGMQS